ncbi:MAG: hypothetical protein DMG73_08300 [Acidobacteria bacterium]|nr:MAG: hypothetical protein DMG75_04425 [Acidobacteriota bacterium]PYX59590.1 MAG: hypothetical protein DMG73_08300 [Acidobacteriota bacterium]
MNWLVYASWLVGPALEIALLTSMIQRKLHVVFPRFFSYILFQIVKSGFLFVIYRYYDGGYFDAYWTGNAISVLLAVTVMDEILRNLFKQYGGIQNLGSIIFRWACGLLLLLSIVNAFSSQEANPDRVVAAVLAFDRSVRVMQCGLFLLLMLLCRFLRHCWRQHVFGIALGFGVFASIELILISIVMHYGDGPGAIVSLANSAAYNAVTLLWIVYFRQQSQSIPEIDVAPELNALNVVLVSSTHVGDNDFLSMAEKAVERVLSRSSWPRPSAKGSQIVGRKPKPEERN